MPVAPVALRCVAQEDDSKVEWEVFLSVFARLCAEFEQTVEEVRVARVRRQKEEQRAAEQARKQEEKARSDAALLANVAKASATLSARNAARKRADSGAGDDGWD